MESDAIENLKMFFENSFMKTIMAAFGASVDSITNILGYYVGNNSKNALIFGNIFSILLSSRIISREENEKTAEFLLSKPLTRYNIFISKFLAYLSMLLIFNIVLVLSGYISLEIFKNEDYSYKAFFIISFYSFLSMLTFGMIGMLISLLFKRGKAIMGISIGIIISCYFIFAISNITESIDVFGYISPFKFVNSDVLNPNYGIEWWRVSYFMVLSTISFVIAYIKYKNKDILI